MSNSSPRRGREQHEELGTKLVLNANCEGTEIMHSVRRRRWWRARVKWKRRTGHHRKLDYHTFFFSGEKSALLFLFKLVGLLVVDPSLMDIWFHLKWVKRKVGEDGREGEIPGKSEFTLDSLTLPIRQGRLLAYLKRKKYVLFQSFYHVFKSKPWLWIDSQFSKSVWWSPMSIQSWVGSSSSSKLLRPFVRHLTITSVDFWDSRDGGRERRMRRRDDDHSVAPSQLHS